MKAADFQRDSLRSFSGSATGVGFLLLVAVLAAGCDGDRSGSEAISGSGYSGEREKSGGAPRDVVALRGGHWKIGPVGAAYYESGPAQGRPPDGDVPPETRVRLIEKSDGYAHVEWNGTSGWVAEHSLVQIENAGRDVHKIPMH